ncbi:MAG: response regulator transcription factor [Acidobacteriaceae bacterium]|jgi:two-component system copper resistance phosphate regulon response regulator CusR|nr:response regulator transcription factor [Acidobacteriaceae bacterium]
MRLLLVEDEQSAARMIAKGLREHGHAVDAVADGDAAIRQASAIAYDLIVLDLLLPVKSGLDVCREIRAAGNAVPVLMLTARDAVNDRIAGLDAGADDYLTKPFHLDELFARIRALARRRMLPLLPEHIDCGALTLDTRTHEARLDGQLLELTAREYALLEYLCRKQGTVVSRDEIAEHVWDGRYDPCSNVIDVYVQRLRRKIDRGATSFIRTRRGAGYQVIGFQAEPE